ncbi:hypothetical protein FOMPIDRAFT_1053246 [Fomitopsis schrenkii]|uniref:KOW domain-containing protein n=1 Tax=Fomitopsis schrenkii TaxID=2126942 RepID=S8F3W5_FOMSC|nr:hypothetical protein FOMPIDRAFT_1053246 [Fomitopsis schrenkii]
MRLSNVSLAKYASLGEPQGVHTGIEKGGEQSTRDGEKHKALDLHMHNSVCIGKTVSILRGPWKSYRGRVVCASRHDAFLVELEIVGKDQDQDWSQTNPQKGGTRTGLIRTSP